MKLGRMQKTFAPERISEMTEKEKPECKVRGLIKPNAMCGYIIVGGQYCGFKGDCKHKTQTTTQQPDAQSSEQKQKLGMK